MMLKTDLRKYYLAQQQNLSAAERFEKSQQISNRFFQDFVLENVQNLHIFLSIEKNNEIETQIIYEKIWREFSNIKTVVPRINVEFDEIESVQFNSETQLSQNKWQIFEPTENILIDEQTIDLVVVPLLCFDKKGFRVGYGKGYYDKFLAKCRVDCLKVGINYFSPAKEISDINKFDVTLDYCVTPEKVWKF